MTGDLDQFRFNRAVAHIRSLTNAIGETLKEPVGAADPAAGAVLREALETAVQLLGPMMPHLAEELWQALGHATLLADTPWPQADAALAVEDKVTYAVQVNGKLRATIELDRGLSREIAESEALKHEAVRKAMLDRPARKIIVVPDRIVNVVL